MSNQEVLDIENHINDVQEDGNNSDLPTNSDGIQGGTVTVPKMDDSEHEELRSPKKITYGATTNESQVNSLIGETTSISKDARYDAFNYKTKAYLERTCKKLHYPWCPSLEVASSLAWKIVFGLALWGVVYSLLEETSTPPHGQLFKLLLLCITSQLGGWLIGFINLPPLLGMLLVGIIFKSSGFISFTDGYLIIVANLRKTALAIILIRAGLGLDPDALKRLSGMVLRLAAIPALTEASCVALVTHYILDLPWIWGFLLGACLAAVSPAVVIPCLFSLQERGYGVSKGIPTLVVAAASIDDVIAVSLFGVLLSIMFSEGSLTNQIIQGPAGILIGIVFGVLWGYVSRWIPMKTDPHVNSMRTLLVGVGGLLIIFGSETIGFEGAGPLGCIIAPFLACKGWKEQGWDAQNPVVSNFADLWRIFQPILFGLIGTEINVFVLEMKTVLLGIACLSISLCARIIISALVAMGGNLNWKEKIFVSLAWFPKATVQAALGPVALDIVRSENRDQTEEAYARIVLVISVLAILITAPVGATFMTVLGPRLLTKETPVNENRNEIRSGNSNNSAKNNEGFDETV